MDKLWGWWMMGSCLLSWQLKFSHCWQFPQGFLFVAVFFQCWWKCAPITLELGFPYAAGGVEGSVPKQLPSHLATPLLLLFEKVCVTYGFHSFLDFTWWVSWCAALKFFFSFYQVVYNVGLCICLYDITKLEDSYIFPGDGASHTKGKCFPSVILCCRRLINDLEM